MYLLKLFLMFIFVSLVGHFAYSKSEQIQTLVICEPKIINLSCYVPVVKNGPFINRACRPRLGCSISSVLPAMVEHTKSQDCPENIARLLAEQSWAYHKNSLPLTIFNGWQWEYYYSLSQFENETYDLDKRGGSWETVLHAVVEHTQGFQDAYWIETDQNNGIKKIYAGSSEIEILSFSKLRTRHGYPKKRKL